MHDLVIGVIAPHVCLGCQSLGSVLCRECIGLYFEFVPSRCAGCKKLTDNFKTCSSCYTSLPLKSIYVASNYDQVSEKLVSMVKFEYMRAGILPMAEIMATVLSQNDVHSFVVCHVPTAPSRIRERGFDHAKLLAKQLSKLLRIKEEEYLLRLTNTRQVGASRTQRVKQTKEAFSARQSDEIKGKNVLLVDDVMTTGATLSASANLLRKAGAKSVSAIVFAQKM